MPDPKLKPCPFCGDEAYYETTTDPDGGCNCVRCETCNFDLMSGPIGIGWYKTKADAAQAWNHRAA